MKQGAYSWGVSGEAGCPGASGVPGHTWCSEEGVPGSTV